MTLGEYVMAVIEWAVVPLVLAAILIYSLFFIPEERAHPRVKTSAQAGKWAGLVVFVIYVISLRNRAAAFSFEPPNYQFVLWPTVFAGFAGFAASGLFDLIRSTRFIGFLVLALVSAASISIYSYLFVRAARNDLVFILLGFVLGALLFEILFPDGLPGSWVRTLRGERRERAPEQRESRPTEDEREPTLRR